MFCVFYIFNFVSVIDLRALGATVIDRGLGAACSYIDRNLLAHTLVPCYCILYGFILLLTHVIQPYPLTMQGDYEHAQFALSADELRALGEFEAELGYSFRNKYQHRALFVSLSDLIGCSLCVVVVFVVCLATGFCWRKR